jgi:hypothetical protein
MRNAIIETILRAIAGLLALTAGAVALLPVWIFILGGLK